ncbi:uncharacterized protein PHALS_09669 [Plasmopara halstedii]|uniref:Uncharacterized protein n=1 Tax=Plasmopara halstedii TaxID=4781 RepID=A0A0P1AFK7_PLAHL|nr:uncharacterized protein PHALS_09669 [Plasmopara halstedii]CEG39422.1 hypothetical protein PHALS_09669 [Plasmopara halstedii]|eukprot:XP_024575791.1 hypothetical protein PHALS_09669 [Plasmopara halstedii]
MVLCAHSSGGAVAYEFLSNLSTKAETAVYPGVERLNAGMNSEVVALTIILKGLRTDVARANTEIVHHFSSVKGDVGCGQIFRIVKARRRT